MLKILKKCQKLLRKVSEIVKKVSKLLKMSKIIKTFQKLLKKCQKLLKNTKKKKKIVRKNITICEWFTCKTIYQLPPMHKQSVRGSRPFDSLLKTERQNCFQLQIFSNVFTFFNIYDKMPELGG